MYNQTIEKLRSISLGAMAGLHLQHVEQNRFGGMTCDEYLTLLTDHPTGILQEQQNPSSFASGRLQAASRYC